MSYDSFQVCLPRSPSGVRLGELACDLLGVRD